MSEAPTPNDMPPKTDGKKDAPPPAEEAAPSSPPAPPVMSEKDITELARLRKIHADEQKWERRAKENFEDAQKFRAFQKSFGEDKGSDEFDPRAEFEKLRRDVESERTERVREEVARVNNMHPEDITGQTREEMDASAERYVARFNERLDEALKAKSAPPAPSASTVTANAKIGGAEQITTREELAKMSPKDRMQAYQDGRLNQLIGKT